MAKGKKDCPKCNIEVGARCLTCPDCGFDFSSAKKKTSQGDRISPEVAKLFEGMEPYEEPERLTPNGHAKRILSYGRERALSLFKLAKTHHYWSHVDWNVVEKGLM